MGTHPRSDADPGELLARTAAGDGDAFGLFYDRFEAELLRFFLRGTGRAELAADLTAETFAAALASAAGYRRELGPARSWLFGIARHELHDAWQRGRVDDEARRQLGMEAVMLSAQALDGISELLDGAGGGEALRLLETLAPDQAAAVRGRVLEDRAYPELAASLRCSESVVRQRVSRGLRSLRSRLEQSR